MNGIYCEHIKHEKIMWCCDDGRDNNYSSLVVKSRRVLLMEVIIIIFFFILDWVPGRFSTDIIFMWLAGMQHHAAAACMMYGVWRYGVVLLFQMLSQNWRTRSHKQRHFFQVIVELWTLVAHFFSLFLYKKLDIELLKHHLLKQQQNQ